MTKCHLGSGIAYQNSHNKSQYLISTVMQNWDLALTPSFAFIEADGPACTFILWLGQNDTLHLFALSSTALDKLWGQHYCVNTHWHDLCREPRLFRPPYFDNSVRTSTAAESYGTPVTICKARIMYCRCRLPFWLVRWVNSGRAAL